jgi:hypothetical protein
MANPVPGTTQLFILADPEIQALLADNETSLAELLAREGIQISAGTAPNPASREGVREKEPVSILIGTAAVIVALTPIILRAISALSPRKPLTITEMVCVPVEDSKGNVVRDSSDNPVLAWVERTKVLESSKEEGQKLSISGPLGVKISYENKSEG